MLAEPVGDDAWRALVKPGKKVGVGERLVFPSPSGDVVLEAEVLERGAVWGTRRAICPGAGFFCRIGADWAHAAAALHPPRRCGSGSGKVSDGVCPRARFRGCADGRSALHAANTGGDCRIGCGNGAGHIACGPGNLCALARRKVEEVRLHREGYTLPESTAEAVNRARSEGRRIVAVGTTVVRTLEAAARSAEEGLLKAHTGTTEIFIAQGFRFRVVNALLTNFHLPRSSLLMLVSAFGGREHVLAAYLARRWDGLPFFQLRRLHVRGVAGVRFQRKSIRESAKSRMALGSFLSSVFSRLAPATQRIGYLRGDCRSLLAESQRGGRDPPAGRNQEVHWRRGTEFRLAKKAGSSG